MPVLPNARHELFAQEILLGKSQTDAYIDAGYKATAFAARTSASALMTKPNILARIEELKQGAADKAEVTAADIARQLDEDRSLAQEVKHAGAAVSASMGKAKVLGLIKERHEHTGANGGPIRHDMSLFNDEQLAQLQTILGSVANIGGGPGGNPPSGGA